MLRVWLEFELVSEEGREEGGCMLREFMKVYPVSDPMQCCSTTFSLQEKTEEEMRELEETVTVEMDSLDKEVRRE